MCNVQFVCHIPHHCSTDRDEHIDVPKCLNYMALHILHPAKYRLHNMGEMSQDTANENTIMYHARYRDIPQDS